MTPGAVGATQGVIYCFDGKKPVKLTGPDRVECNANIVAVEKGFLTGAGNLASRTEYEHDLVGRTTRNVQTTECSPTLGARAVSYKYWASDRISETTLPSGKQVVECIDARLQVIWASKAKSLADCTGGFAVSGADAYVSGAEYEAHGALRSWQLGNGLYEIAGYNDRLQMERKRIGPGGTLSGCGTANDGELCLEWGYGSVGNNNGNVMEARQWSKKTAGGYLNLKSIYSYDGRNRLSNSSESVVSGGSSGGAWSQSNSYDRYGNRWATSSGVTQSDWTPGQSSFVDASTNRITTAKVGASTGSVTYDAAGHMVGHPQVAGALAYDAEGRLVSGGGATYTYDGEGRRVKRVANGSTYWYWYGADGGLIGEDSPEALAPGVQYLSVDALGSTRLVTKQDGTVESRVDYWPFGEEVIASATAGNRDLVSGYGGATAVKQRFTGKERDAETGLDYFGARYLASAQGRFTSPDVPFADQFAENPQSWNLYSYVRNNPMVHIDSNGRGAIHVGKIIFKGAKAAYNGGSFASGALEDAKTVGRAFEKGATTEDYLAAGKAILSYVPVIGDGIDAFDLGKAAVAVGAAVVGTAVNTGGPGDELHRQGTDKESVNRLGKKAAEAEAGIGIHGVSVSGSVPQQPHSTARATDVQNQFPVHDTPTRRDPKHKTVELPKPVTRQAADLFNALFGRKK